MRTFISILGLALVGFVATGPTLQIPDYMCNVVPVHWPKIHKRSLGSVTTVPINAFDKKFTLNLKPTDGILVNTNTPVYYAKSDKTSKYEVTFFRIKNAMTEIFKLFEDRKKQASVLVKRDASGRHLISGNIGSENWVVKPLHDHFSSQLHGKCKRSTNYVNVDSANNTVDIYHEPEYHVIYKNPKVYDEVDYISQPLQEDILNSKASRSKRDIPSIIYLQILVLVDYKTYKLHGEYLYDLLDYLLPFWNSVDMKFKAIKNPKVRINIAGIIVATDANVFPFMSKHKVTPDLVNIHGSLESLSEYMRTVEPYFPLDSYDIAIAMSPYTMCSPTEDRICKAGTLGLAYLGGVCDVRNAKVLKTLSVAVIKDKGGFDGIDTAAHEIGHLLGATHDGHNDSDCLAETGNIMSSTPLLTENSADWSACSLKDIKNNLNSKDTKCLHNVPKAASVILPDLPGRHLSKKDQCMKIEGTEPCYGEDNNCLNLRCISKKNSKYCTDVGNRPADGTPCGIGKICVHGRCLLEQDIN